MEQIPTTVLEIVKKYSIFEIILNNTSVIKEKINITDVINFEIDLIIIVVIAVLIQLCLMWYVFKFLDKSGYNQVLMFLLFLFIFCVLPIYSSIAVWIIIIIILIGGDRLKELVYTPQAYRTYYNRYLNNYLDDYL